jgi:glycosyltransferase involved in cell wall biosynthesis
MFPPEKGGNASRIHDTATHLQGGDWDVTVLSPHPSYPPGTFDRSWRRARTETVDGITVHRLWTWQPTTENPGMARRLPYYLLFGVHAMLWLLWNVREYDVVVTSTPPISTGAPGLLSAALNKPWVVDIRDLWIDASVSLGYLEEDSAIEHVSRRFQRWVLHTADRLTVTTDSLRESVQTQYGDTLGEKTVVIPNGVDTDRFRPDERDGTERPLAVPDNRSDTRRDGGEKKTAVDGETTATDRPTIVYTGNLGSAQDLEACVRAMTHLSEDAVLSLVGSGDTESKLRRVAREIGVEERVEFHGLVPREAVPGLLNEATIGVAPLESTGTLAYAMPTKVYEYMACGLPVVVTGRGEIERFVAESGGGVHAENDRERIAARFDELLADDRRRQQLGEHGREYVVEHYDRGVIARRLSDELSRLVEADAGT